MQMIQGGDKMIASSHHSDVAPRASAPGRAEGRPRKPRVLLLSGLILIGVAAPPMQGTAYAKRAKGASTYDKCLHAAAYAYMIKEETSQADRARRAKLFCDAKHKGVAISKEDQDWMDSLN